MRTIVFLIQKEFLQVFRNRGMLPIIFVMPLIQLLILANAATFEINSVAVSVIDDDGSSSSRRLVEDMVGSGYFEVVNRSLDKPAADSDLELGRTDLILRIPHDMERDLIDFGSARIQLIIDAEDGAAAGVISAYISEIVARFNQRTGPELIGQIGLEHRTAGSIEIQNAYWYNRELDYDTFMVPGILVLLVTIIGLLLSSMNLVREKETGTIEQLNVTPIRKYELIAGKLTPFWILALFELAIGLLVAKLVFDTPTEGSLWLMFAVAAIYLLVVLGIGLFISTVTTTQQQAMFITWFIMVIFILMSGLFTPIESMPIWAQHLTLGNPVAHFIEIMRRIMLKGAGIDGVWSLLVILALFAAGVLTLATRSYSKVSA